MTTTAVMVERGNGRAGLAPWVEGAEEGVERRLWEVRLREWRQDQATWDEAARMWLEAKEAKSGSSNTRRTYEAAVRLFFEASGKRPWMVGGADVMAWQGAMREGGLAETTINLRLAALSSFYGYCHRKFAVATPFGGDEPLAVFNPVDRVERSTIDVYEKAFHLEPEQVRALLRAIRRETVVGARDYALISAYIYTGRRSAEIRHLKWGDIVQREGRVFYTWGKEKNVGKGSRRTDELPLPAWNAILAYAEAAGLDVEAEDAYIFVALSDVATRLPNVAQMPENRPLSAAMVNRIVKKCARRAGLKWRLIRTHTLRHTAAQLRRRFTNDPEKIQHFLAHKNIATSMIYMHKTEQRTDDLWAQVETLIGIEE